MSKGLSAGAIAGVALGCGYLGAGMGKDVVTHAKAARLAKLVGGNVSEDAFRALAADDTGAFAVALRTDPSLLGGFEARERHAVDLAEQLNKKAGEGGVGFLRTKVTIDNPAAQPWQINALTQTREVDCLAQAVYYEARGETAAGQAAVAQVVLNRVRHPAFPKSVCGVVYQGSQGGHGCQFSFACNGSMRRTREAGAWRQAETIAARALSGYVMAEVGNATHFHVTSISPGWGPSLMRVSQIGMHVFYRFSGRKGAPGTFSAEPDVAPVQDETVSKPIFASFTITPIDGGDVAKAAGAIVDVVTGTDTARAVAAPAPAKSEPSKTETAS